MTPYLPLMRLFFALRSTGVRPGVSMTGGPSSANSIAGGLASFSYRR